MSINKNTKILAADSTIANRFKDLQSHPIRTEFQRDRDRILYSKAFRRLGGKTQVFLSIKDDHVRNRLTHTLEVNQISQTISKALGLNLELTEAIALGHDLGHTPFGHVGERTLNHIMNGCYRIGDFNLNIHDGYKGFKHNLQGIRVVHELENDLNLTKEVLWGILNHSKLKYSDCNKDGHIQCSLKHNTFKKGSDCGNEPMYKYNLNFYNNLVNDINSIKYLTIEALVVKSADEIAQRHHDIEDAIEFGILSIDDLVDEIKNRFEDIFSEEEKKSLEEIKEVANDKYKATGLFSKLIVNFLTTDLIMNSVDKLENFMNEHSIKKLDTFNHIKENCDIDTIKKLICFSNNVEEKDRYLQIFLKNRILNSFDAQRMDGLGQYVIIKLFEAYIHNPQQLPDKTIKKLYKTLYDNISINENKNLDEKYIIDSNIKSKFNQCEYEKNKNNVGKIREIISYIHYNIEDNSNSKYNIYNDTLLRVICDYISGMTDKYALQQHRQLYNCGNIMF